MVNRVMRLKNNPDARGFTVSVLEETDRNDELGIINFKCVARIDCGTRKMADRVYDNMKKDYITNNPDARK
jgi:hypothetical protein